MKKDLVLDIFLSFSLMALLFLFFFPAYFLYGQIAFRSVGVAERMFSVIFVLLWFTLCALTAYTKKISLLIGGILFAVMAYIPEWVLSRLVTGNPKPSGLVTSLIISFFRRIYEWINAPMVGISMLFDPQSGPKLSKFMLPILLGVFILVQLFRYYRDAYLAEQLRLDPTPSTTAYEISRMSTENASSRTTKSAGIRTYAEAEATAPDIKPATPVPEAEATAPDMMPMAPDRGAEPVSEPEVNPEPIIETESRLDFPDVSASDNESATSIERSDVNRYN